jgi:hypothetical protein
MFWFENDLNFVNTKITPKQHYIWQKMKKNKKIGMLMRNNQMTKNNNRVVEKAHWKYQGC